MNYVVENQSKCDDTDGRPEESIGNLLILDI